MASQFYLNNPNLKAIGVPVEFTKENVEEYVKCSKDPIYFIKTYVKIISLDKGLVNFDLYPYQERFIRSLHENRFVVSMQSRQMGKTQTVAAYIVWYLLFNDDKTVAILANKATAAREIMSRVQLMVEYLPKWLQQGVVEWNKGSIEFENNSKAFTAATSSSGIRGKSVNLLYVDEAGIISNSVAEEFFTSTYPTISSGETTKIIMTSTPLGLNHFWKFWTEAESGINGFVPVRVDYWEHPNRDDKWAEEQRKILGELKFNQEVLCQFLGSSLSLISGDALQRLTMMKPIFEKDGTLRAYEQPDKDGSYVMLVDTSEGLSQDYSTFSIIRLDVYPYKQVATYRCNKTSPLVYPNVIFKWAKQYNDALVLIEANKAEQVAHILHYELEYDNILFVSQTAKGQRITVGGSQWRLGVKMDKRVKRIGCTNLKDLIEEGKLLVHDSETISELGTFIEKRGSYAADDGKHDDMVMTLVLFGWLANDPYFKELTDINLRKTIFEQRLQAIENEVLPTGFFNDAVPDSAHSTQELNRKLPSKELPYHLTPDQIELLNW